MATTSSRGPKRSPTDPVPAVLLLRGEPLKPEVEPLGPGDGGYYQLAHREAPHHVVNARCRPAGSVSSPTHATYPSGRMSTAAGDSTSPVTGSDQRGSSGTASTRSTRFDQSVASRSTDPPLRSSRTGRAVCSNVYSLRGPAAVFRSASGTRAPTSGWSSPSWYRTSSAVIISPSCRVTGS